MSFIFSWVKINKLAVGTCPCNAIDSSFLKKNGIKSILSLCSEKEILLHEDVKKNFNYKRIVLPDHKSKNKLTKKRLFETLDYLSLLLDLGPTFVHCYASIERSPLICMAWLVKNERIKPEVALNHLMNVHPRSCPLSDQLILLNELY